MSLRKYVASNGYVVVMGLKGHPMANARGWVYEHRLVASGIIGRPLKRSEPVHHRNHDKTDNRPENLEVCASAAEHGVEHRSPSSRQRKPGEPNPTVQCACGCGASFARFDKGGRPRIFARDHGGGTTLGFSERREKILAVHAQVPKFRDVARILNISRDTVAYHVKASAAGVLHPRRGQ